MTCSIIQENHADFLLLDFHSGFHALPRRERIKVKEFRILKLISGRNTSAAYSPAF
jgi:hypothetical protein